MAETVIKSKLCNALMNSAVPNKKFDAIAHFAGSSSAVRTGLAAATKLVGGTWVGGRTELTDKRVVFSPNSLNSALQDGLSVVSLDLNDITDVKVRWGVATSIIDIETQTSSLTVRCYGARRFAEEIRAARDRVTSG